MRKELKRFERLAEKSKDIPEGILKLAFCDVDLKNSRLVFEKNSFDNGFVAAGRRDDHRRMRIRGC